jgi:hypothetical protein
MENVGGVRVVMSPVQLAAVVSNQSLDVTAMATNRLWGGLQLVGGVLEMMGAGVLCVMPEPTGASKLGCVAFGAHGVDTAAAGLRQVWTARDTETLTQQGVGKLAEAMRVSPEAAGRIGLSLDIAVPFGIAGMVKAARVSSVTLGRISLIRHEATMANPRLGGHTIARHVGRTEAQLRERLKLEPGIRIASSFSNVEMAEWSISYVMQRNASKVKAWVISGNDGSRLDLIEKVGRDVGYGVVRQTGEFQKLDRVFIVLKRERYNGMPYYILTSYLGR